MKGCRVQPYQRLGAHSQGHWLRYNGGTRRIEYRLANARVMSQAQNLGGFFNAIGQNPSPNVVHGGDGNWWRKPITGIAGCCARAASGHAATPPSPAMKSRRRIRDPRAISGEPILVKAAREPDCRVFGSPFGPFMAHGCPASIRMFLVG